jgi:SAM-dependent methyltransferase
MYSKIYNQSYFDNLGNQTFSAAKIILNDLYNIYKFRSLIDIGCGHGSWLRAAYELRTVEKITGVDGFYTKKLHQNFLKFSKINFIYTNLEDKFLINRLSKYDLALSLETAEHLSPKRAKSFINDLCNISDVVLFSAAVDGHGGQNHLNENHQSYWIKLFEEQKYDPFIVIDRKKYWFHEAFKKCPYYVSGTFLFIKNNTKIHADLIEYKVNKNQVVDIVHPYILQWRKDENFGVKMNLRRLIKSLIKFFKKNLTF